MPTTSYVVAAGDSIERVALALTGDQANWRTLAQWNSLDFPYIVSDLTPYLPVAASGTVTVTGPTSSSWTVPQGFLFAQPPLPNGGYQVQYKATVAMQGGSGTASVSVPVVCTQAGQVGNCGPSMVTVIVSSGLPSSAAATNAAPFTNGAAPNVLGPGGTLLIPASLSKPGPAPQAQTGWLTLLGGTSLRLATDGDLVVGPDGSLSLVSGGDNLLQNWAMRVLTQRGDFPLHPGFGTELDALMASGKADATDLILADIRESIQADPRVATVTDVAVVPAGLATTLQVTATVVPVGQNTNIPLNVLLGGG